MRKMVLYLAVTQDEYELPIAVAGSARELGGMLGVKEHTILTHINLIRKGKLKRQKYLRIEIEEERDEVKGIL